MNSLLHIISKLSSFILLYCLISALDTRSNSVSKFDNEFNGQLWYNKQNAAVKRDQIRSRDGRKYHRKRSWNEIRNNQFSTTEKSRPPYYLSYDSGHQTNYEYSDNLKLDGYQQLNNYASDQEYRLSEQPMDNNFDDQRVASEESANTDERVYSKPTKDSSIRKVGKKGLNGTFGFLLSNRFYRCDKPKRIDKVEEGDHIYYIIPDDLNYYHRCVYFDDDPSKRNQRKIGKLGRNGFFGYYENGVFVECERPLKVEKDANRTDVFYIPHEINYNPKCQYFERNLTGVYDYIPDSHRNSSGVALNPKNVLCFLLLLICGQNIV